MEDRKAAILSAVVEEYIQTAQPVGSERVAASHAVEVSSATIRSELANLEDQGYLMQPHTSAGRIPTEKAYRFFVDHLGVPGALDTADREQVQAFFSRSHREMEQMLADTSNLLADLTPDDYDLILGLNLRAAIFAVQAVAGRMTETGTRGSIINMSSQMGHVGAAKRSLYCASKWALEGFTKSVAIELGPQGIRVNTVCPTFIETPLTKPYFEDPAFATEILAKIKLGRVGQVQDVVGAAVFLASDASSMTTGSAIMVDGGWTAE